MISGVIALCCLLGCLWLTDCTIFFRIEERMGVECKCMHVITIFQNVKWVVVLYLTLIVSGYVSQTLICKT